MCFVNVGINRNNEQIEEGKFDCSVSEGHGIACCICLKCNNCSWNLFIIIIKSDRAAYRGEP